MDDQIEVRRCGAVELPTAQMNEVLAKVLCHNLTCIVHTIADFGIGRRPRHPHHAAVPARARRGRLGPVAKALHVDEDTIAKVARGRRQVTARLALRVARLIEVGVDDLLAGRHMFSLVCPHCGHTTADFVDEEMVVTDHAPADELAVLDGASRDLEDRAVRLARIGLEHTARGSLEQLGPRSDGVSFAILAGMLEARSLVRRSSIAPAGAYAR